MPTPDQVRSRMEAYAACFAQRDRDAFVGSFAEQAVQIDPVGSPPNVGRQAIGGFWDNVTQLADQMSFDIVRLHVCGDEAAVVFSITARSGESATLIEGVDIVRIDDDGLIVSLTAYWDPGQVSTVA